jgi:P-type conjugative transfer ATPase TrbB
MQNEMKRLLQEREEGKRRIEEMLRRELGALILEALADNDVIEIMLNPDGHIWLDRMGSGMMDTGEVMHRAAAENLLCTLAGYANTEISAEKPLLEIELPIDGSRFEGLLPPVVSSPVFAIRKRPGRIFTLGDYVAQSIITLAHAAIIRTAIRAKDNILIVGGTGSGKTTFANSLLHEMAQLDSSRRLVLIEDTVELQCTLPNHVALRTSTSMDMARCLKAAMRLRPDSIVIGEVRGAEALALVKAWNTGHPGGLATIHASSARSGLIRLEQLVQEAGVVPQPAVIAEAVKLIVFICKIKESPGRLVSEILRVSGYAQGKYVVENL